nr:MAG TPA: hypothetical protein [Caudoviricetes sp.]
MTFIENFIFCSYPPDGGLCCLLMCVYYLV